ncbi:MAG TPA: YajG family lipoprotein [Pseudomonadales bacterium]|nr:YajG family lipoprotein [Pseudomonadales bacterium]
MLAKHSPLSKIFMLLTCSLFLSACAVSPQTVAIKPDLKVPSMPIGHNRPVSVETQDLRRDKTLGTLGGIYNSAYISTDAQMQHSITQAAVNVLQSWDFAAVTSALGNDDMAHFALEIIDLDYQRPQTSVGGNVVVKCRIGVKISMNGATYSGEYLSQRSEQVAIIGTPNGNDRMVNETINQALNQMFLDKKLQRFMAR